MEDNKKIDFATMFINEIERRKMKKLNKEKIFIDFNKSLCNNVLYTDSKYKESTIILNHIFNNLMVDFIKEVNDCVNKVGAYKNE